MLDYKNKVTIVYLLAFFIDLANMFITTVAFPNIGKDLHATFEQLSWITNIYTLALALVIPVSAWLSDKYGIKKIFLFALIGSLISIILCGLSNTIMQLLFWRFIQGLCGGLLIPVGQTLVYRQFPAHERAKLSMIILTVASIAPAISPTIGGIIVGIFNWRWVFLINIPVLLIIIIISYIWIIEEYHPHPTKFDLFGMILISISLASILYGLSSFKTIDDIIHSCRYVGCGVILMALFYVYTKKVKYALLKLDVIKNRLFIIGAIYYLSITGVFTGINILNIFLFQSVLGISPAHTGVLMLPFALGAFSMTLISGKLFHKIGPKPLAFIILTIWLIGILLLIIISNKSEYNLAYVAYFCMGIGSGTIAYIAQSISMLSTENINLSKASAVWNLNRQLSFSFGVAIFAMIFQLLLSHFGIYSTTSFVYSPEIIKTFHYCYIIAALISIIPISATCYINNKTVLKLLIHNHA